MQYGRSHISALSAVVLIGWLTSHVHWTEGAPPVTPTEGPPPNFRIGPIDGLTTAWHAVPTEASIPLGTTVELYREAPSDALVFWSGAEERERTLDGSTAECMFHDVGRHTVTVTVIPQRPEEDRVPVTNTALFESVDLVPDDIVVSLVEVAVDPIKIDENLPPDRLNQITMGYYFNESIAGLHDRGDGRYLTSIYRTVSLKAEVEPAGFAPLTEWRFDGKSSLMDIGSQVSHSFAQVGRHRVSVGPISRPQTVEIETYKVEITNHSSEQHLPDGEPIVFTGTTDPRGYEGLITWLASTKFGTGEPILGRGPRFVVEFNDTWGSGDDGNPHRWLGVKADQAFLGEDQKCGIFPSGPIHFSLALPGMYDDPEVGRSTYFFTGNVIMSVTDDGQISLSGFELTGMHVDGFDRGVVQMIATENGSGKADPVSRIITEGSQPILYSDDLVSQETSLDLVTGHFECLLNVENHRFVEITARGSYDTESGLEGEVVISAGCTF